MRAWLRKWGRVLKTLFVLAVLASIAWVFGKGLLDPRLWLRPLPPGWLVLSGLLYLVGLGFSALFWMSLLRGLGQPAPPLYAGRAYYIGHLGKYVPGKAWALLLRVGMAQAFGVRVGVAAMTTFYEVLTTMAAGALLGVLVFAFVLPEPTTSLDRETFRRMWEDVLRVRANLDPLHAECDRRLCVLVALLVLLPVGLPVVPPIFNRLVERLTRRFRQADAAPLAPVRWHALTLGLGLAAVGWLFLGASAWACLQAVMGQPPPWSLTGLLRWSAFVAVGSAAGFVLGVPGQLGVREVVLVVGLTPELLERVTPDEGSVAAVVLRAVLVLRLVVTAAEVLLSGVLYWFRPAEAAPAPAREPAVVAP